MRPRGERPHRGHGTMTEGLFKETSEQGLTDRKRDRQAGPRWGHGAFDAAIMTGAGPQSSRLAPPPAERRIDVWDIPPTILASDLTETCS